MMKLYWAPRTRSFSALWLMEETGQPYERVLTDISAGAQKTPEYLAINPMGKVPALRDGDATLAEAAAICAYVAERYPEARLAPPGRSAAGEISLLAVLCARLHRARDGAGRDQDRDEFRYPRAGAMRSVCSTCSIPRWRKGRGLLGDTFSAADIAIGSGLNFAVRLFKMVPSRPSFEAYIERCMARPAFQRAEKLAAGRSSSPGLTGRPSIPGDGRANGAARTGCPAFAGHDEGGYSIFKSSGRGIEMTL